MNVSRKFRLSVWQQIRDNFLDGTIMGVPWRVYGESDLRAGFPSTVRPCVFLLDFGADLRVEFLPFIVIETSTDRSVLELGNTGTFMGHIRLHVFGRSRGERDDIASGVMSNVSAIQIRDYDTVGEPVLETQWLEPDRDGNIWTQELVNVPESLYREGSMREWVDIAASCWILSS